MNANDNVEVRIVSASDPDVDARDAAIQNVAEAVRQAIAALIANGLPVDIAVSGLVTTASFFVAMSRDPANRAEKAAAIAAAFPTVVERMAASMAGQPAAVQ